MMDDTTELNSYEIKRSKGFYAPLAFWFFIAFIVNIIIKKRREDFIAIFYPVFNWQSVLFIFMIGGLLFYIIWGLMDNKVKLKISNSGIWTAKYGNIDWADVWYIYVDTGNNSRQGTKLIIKMKDDIEKGVENEEYKIQLDTLNIDFTRFWKTINFYANKYGFQSLEHDI